MIKNDRIRKIINKTFRNLKANGYLTLHGRSITCCSGCSLYKIEDIKRKKGITEPRPYAYYHKQDEEYLNKKDLHGILYIGFGHDTNSQIVNTGSHIAKLFETNGVLVDWNGKADTRIKVKF